MSVDFIGPISDVYYDFAVNGYKVPYITGYLSKEGMWSLLVDKRMGYEEMTEEELRKVLPLLANAMAVAAGYPCHGVEQKRNMHRIGVMHISATHTEIADNEIHITRLSDEE